MGSTNEAYSVLRGAVRAKNLATDPNLQAVYMGTKRRLRNLGPVAEFAHRASENHGGSPTIAFGKIDTRKGWRPHALTEWARNQGLDAEEMGAVIEELDVAKDKKERGVLWEMVNRGVGSWRNDNTAATVSPTHYRSVLSETHKPVRLGGRVAPGT
jgi:hypothetical protein